MFIFLALASLLLIFPQTCPTHSWCLSYCLLCGNQLLFALWVLCTMVSKQCKPVLGNRPSRCGISSELQQLRVCSNYLQGLPAPGSKEHMCFFLQGCIAENFPLRPCQVDHNALTQAALLYQLPSITTM